MAANAIPESVRALVAKWRGLANDALRRSGTWNGNDIADRIEFMADELEAIAQQPAVDEALDRMRHAPNRLWMADLVGQQISVDRMRDILSFALAAQHQEPTR